MKRFNKTIITVASGLLLAAALPINTSGIAHADTTSTAGLHFLGRWNSKAGVGGAEFTAYDAATSRLFVANSASKQVDVLDFSNPSRPKRISSIKLASKGAISIQSVAADQGLVAIAASVGSQQAPGKVFFADTDGKIINSVVVGAQPVDVKFSPNGRYVLSANKGTPSSYCKASDGTLPLSTDPLGTVSIIDVSGAKPAAATTVDFTDFNERGGALGFQGGRAYGPGASVAQDLEPTSIAMSSDSKFAYVTLQVNNAYALLDMSTMKITGLYAYNTKKHSTDGKGIDAANDGAAVIANPSVNGMYQPGSIASLAGVDGNTYLITANEGAPRAYPCLLGGTSTTAVESENQPISSIYDASDSAITAVSGAVGALQVTQFAPATARSIAVSSSTKVKSAYTFGTRSFSVWKAYNLEGIDTAEQVFDSGAELETKISQLRPQYFNRGWNAATGSANSMETYSTLNGPAVNTVATGTAYGKDWIIAGMKNDGGVVLYDATNPVAPTFVDYSNQSNPAGNFLTEKATAAAGDVAPNGLQFIAPSDSPTGSALIVVSYDKSGTVGVFEIPSDKPGAPKTVSATSVKGSISVSFKKSTSLGWNGSPTFTAKCVSTKGKITATGTKSPIKVSVPAAKAGASFKCSVRANSILGNSAYTSAPSSVISK